MIEADLKKYLEADTALTTLLGRKIFIMQAPTNAQMPYAVIEIFSGPRERITPVFLEQRANCRFTVNTGPQSSVLGRQIIEAILRAIENFRGGMGDSNDLSITCGAVRSLLGLGGVMRYQFDAVATSVETLQKP